MPSGLYRATIALGANVGPKLQRFHQALAMLGTGAAGVLQRRADVDNRPSACAAVGRPATDGARVGPRRGGGRCTPLWTAPHRSGHCLVRAAAEAARAIPAHGTAAHRGFAGAACEAVRARVCVAADARPGTRPASGAPAAGRGAASAAVPARRQLLGGVSTVVARAAHHGHPEHHPGQF
eukprot:ctg_1106.g426